MSEPEPAAPLTQPALAMDAALLEQLRRELDPSNRAPLYEQLRSGLERLIQLGLLPPNTMLPPEPELARTLGVSRQTVNQALSDLSDRGILTRRRGVGTSVTPPLVEQPLEGLYSFMRTLLAQGRTPTARLLGYRPAVRREASSVLTGDPEALIFELVLLRQIDGEPVVLETIYLPRPCGEALPLDRVGREPLYDLLATHCGLTITHAEETLRPLVLRPREAALLQARPGEAAFLVERVGYAGEQAMEVRRSTIRGDRYRFHVRLAGSHLEQPSS